MSCKKKIKHTCGTRTPASCVFHDIDIPEYSNLSDEECLTADETTEDLYKLITSIRESLDLTEFEKSCLDLTKVKDTYNKDSVYLVKDVLQEMNTEICNLKEGKEEEDELSLDFKCLVDTCGTPISSLKELLQVLINEVCKLKQENE